MDLGMGEILLILLVALLVYGGRLPEVARSLGRSVGTLKRSLSETSSRVTREFDEAAAGMQSAEDDRPRTVKRLAPKAPPEVAQEDLTAPRPDDAPPA